MFSKVAFVAEDGHSPPSPAISQPAENEGAALEEGGLNSKFEAEKQPTFDWTGPDDPDNPNNWSLAKKVWHVIIPALFGFAM